MKNNPLYNNNAKSNNNKPNNNAKSNNNKPNNNKNSFNGGPRLGANNNNVSLPPSKNVVNVNNVKVNINNVPKEVEQQENCALGASSYAYMPIRKVLIFKIKSANTYPLTIRCSQVAHGRAHNGGGVGRN